MERNLSLEATEVVSVGTSNNASAPPNKAPTIGPSQ